MASPAEDPDTAPAAARVVLERTFQSRSPEATEALGEALGRRLGPGAVVALVGELGTGKTCLVRGLARGLGVEGPVTSPSFTLMHQYPGPVELRHFDAWMEGRERAFLEGGGAEWLYGEGVAVIEWAGRVQDWLPAPRLELLIEHRGPAERLLRVRLLAPAGDGTEPREADPHGLRGALEGLRGGPELAEGLPADSPGAGVNRGPGGALTGADLPRTPDRP